MAVIGGTSEPEPLARLRARLGAGHRAVELDDVRWLLAEADRARADEAALRDALDRAEWTLNAVVERVAAAGDVTAEALDRLRAARARRPRGGDA